MKDTKQNKNINKYIQRNPKKAEVILKAVKRGVKEYEEAFRRLAAS